ncbi:dihydrolipoyl dehydrogenase family protein [Alkalibacterium olivapovliticus]|uniref:Glutathione reductase (NADPH) n=1 Tax=Alkalibacterium olivapovliticus TaxID=99907 RepID=A0A2T0W9F7_9LACT|nr:NAD(P)/FAD-dependent oxidoreductase [Alkalibacterium olivapovliticus]PRY83134.1 glutathione reductase (NADPH) [Alkalibacterium olivapovliticus]
MEKVYDVIVIGSGVAGKSIASGLATEDKQVAIIEEDLWGGTCPNRGCDPKKVLVSAVEALDQANQLNGKGIKNSPTIDWPELMAFKKTFTDPVSEQSRKGLDSSGAETFTGTAEFIDSKTIKVGDRALKASQFVIATGARPSLLDIPGKEHFLTSDDFLSLPEMPDTITFVGAGYISFELAAIANAAGADVHVIQHNDSPLKAYDQGYVRTVMAELESKGVQFHLNTDLAEINKTDQGYLLCDEADFKLTTDLVFGTTGRIPNTEKLKLENAGVEGDKKGILVNEYLQTSNPTIFALGDVLSKKQPNLTPVSSFESAYLLSYLTDKTTEPIAYPSIPTIVFSTPRLAQVGVSAKEAGDDPDRFDQTDIDATKWFSYSRSNEPVSKIKVITDKQSGLLVGATCLNNKADELINYLAFLIDRKIPAADLSKMVFAYPSIGSDLASIYS